MPGVTNSQGLIYPTGTDRRCDFPEQWGDMADLLQSKIDAVQAVVDRTFPVVPAVLLEKTTPLLFNNAITFTNTIQFERVVMDTDNMSNLSADRTSIRPTRAGLYQIVVYAEMSNTGDTTNWIQLNLTAAGSGTPGLTSSLNSTFVADNGNAWGKQMSVTGLVSWDPDAGTPLTIACEVTYGGTGSATGTTVGYVQMGVYWWSDLP